MIRLLAIRLVDRIKESGNTQKVLTSHSDMILTRLGFHELNEQVCSREGYIVLQLRDDIDAYNNFRNDLNGIYGIEIKEMILCGKADKPEMIPDDARVSLAAVLVHDRNEVVSSVQKVLSLYGCNIRTRLGVNLGNREGEGLIILELTGDSSEINPMLERLSTLTDTCIGVLWFN
jgi:hypothetical protein